MSEPQPGVTTSLLDGVIKFGKEFGAIALILGFYMGQDAGLIGNPVETRLGAIEKEIQEIKGQGIQHDATMKELTRAVEDQGEIITEQAKDRQRAKQRRCVSQAKTEPERMKCFEEEK